MICFCAVILCNVFEIPVYVRLIYVRKLFFQVCQRWNLIEIIAAQRIAGYRWKAMTCRIQSFCGICKSSPNSCCARVTSGTYRGAGPSPGGRAMVTCGARAALCRHCPERFQRDLTLALPGMANGAGTEYYALPLSSAFPYFETSDSRCKKSSFYV